MAVLVDQNTRLLVQGIGTEGANHMRRSTAQSATIEGYITIEDVNSRDASFHELKCADAVCGQ